jgi:hypothetical protein
MQRQDARHPAVYRLQKRRGSAQRSHFGAHEQAVAHGAILATAVAARTVRYEGSRKRHSRNGREQRSSLLVHSVYDRVALDSKLDDGGSAMQGNRR